MGGAGPTPNSLEVIAIIAGAVIIFCGYSCIRAMRETIRAALVLVGLFFLVYLAVLESGANREQAIIGGVVVAGVASLAASKRSRYIPANVKRKVIARDLKGKKYNPKKHHIDHIWPFALGGGNTVDNLRVISKEENQRKGAKTPSFWDWF